MSQAGPPYAKRARASACPVPSRPRDVRLRGAAFGRHRRPQSGELGELELVSTRVDPAPSESLLIRPSVDVGAVAGHPQRLVDRRRLRAGLRRRAEDPRRGRGLRRPEGRARSDLPRGRCSRHRPSRARRNPLACNGQILVVEANGKLGVECDRLRHLGGGHRRREFRIGQRHGQVDLFAWIEHAPPSA